MAGPLATATEGAAADAFAHDPTAARLVAVQLLSPAFPTGGFAYAQGLEWAMDAGIVTDAATLAAHLPSGPDAALAAARKVVWPRSAQVVHRFRRIGLEALLRMSPDDVPGFFEEFFALPDAHRWTYLTARDDIRGIMSAMNCLFRQSSGPLRRHLVTSAFRRRLPSNDALGQADASLTGG